MRAFVFVTREGYTFQPLSESVEPDIENLQVLGFGKGESTEDAFAQFLSENTWLEETSFREVLSFELAHEDFEREAQFFRLPGQAGD